MKQIFVILGALVCVQPVAAWAGKKKVIQIGGDASYWAENRHYGGDTFEQGGSLGVEGEANLPFLSVEASARYARAGTNDVFQVRAGGRVLLLQVHELFYRLDPISGDQARGLVGLGGGVEVGPARISASLGAAAFHWTRTQEEQKKLYAGYAGVNVLMRLWKVEGELRVAYVAAPTFTPDYSYEGWDSLDNLVDHWTTATLASTRVYADMFKIAGVRLGPELRAEFEKLPDGFQWFATAGVAAKTGLF